jgi:hypothetical protein
VTGADVFVILVNDPVGKTPLSNDYGSFYAGKALKETQPGRNLIY